MITWPDILCELESTPVVAADDIWYHLTAAGLAETSMSEAAEAVNLVSAHVPDLATRRVADLGCGVGRHLSALAERCHEVIGVETSQGLAQLASRFVPRARVEVASYHDLAKFGAFDVVCAFSHTLLLAEGPEGVVGSLQLLRGAMPDYGLLVIEAMPIEAGTLDWTTAAGVTIREDRHVTPTGLRHEFHVMSENGTWSTSLASATVGADRWASLAEEGGFHLESAELFAYADGTPSCFYFLRAQKGFNFLSDLADFLESWADPRHPRNTRDIEWAPPDSSGRVRPTGPVALTQGTSLSRHHPDFARSLEGRIRSLVLELAEHWHYVTYSSCGGHLVSSGPPEVFAEAYCGVVAFSNRQVSSISRLLTLAMEDLDLIHTRPEVRIRTLHGLTTSLTAADLLVRRHSVETPWDAYAAEVEQAVDEVVSRLTQMRSSKGERQ